MSIETLIDNYSDDSKQNVYDDSTSEYETIILDGICEICENKSKTVLHHTSYDPEKTIEACHSCHFRIHKDEDFKPDLTPSLLRDEAQEKNLITKRGTLNPLFNIRINDNELAKWIKQEVKINDAYKNENHLFNIAISRLKDNTYDNLQREINKQMINDIRLIQEVKNEEYMRLRQKDYIINALEEDKLNDEDIKWLNYAVQHLRFYNKTEVIKRALKNHKRLMTDIDTIL